MITYLTSNVIETGTDIINEANGFVEGLKKDLPARALNTLFIAASPDRYESNDNYAEQRKRGFENKGFVFSQFSVLDNRNKEQCGFLIGKADMIILAGGHVPTQNSFFVEIGLKEKIKDYEGVVVGISAGTMNSASEVYVHPEKEGEAISKEFRRFRPGLGITERSVIPHYNVIKDRCLDGLRLIEEVAFPDSMGRKFYLLPDGSYFYGNNGREELRGEAYLIENGTMRKICEDGKNLEFH